MLTNRLKIGLVALSLSAVFNGLGNSLEANSILVWLHILLLIYGFEIITASALLCKTNNNDDNNNDNNIRNGSKGPLDLEGESTVMLESSSDANNETNNSNNASYNSSISIAIKADTHQSAKVEFQPSPMHYLGLSLFIILTQGLGVCMGFSTLFGYPTNTPDSIVLAWLAGIGCWIAFVILSLWPAYLFTKKFSNQFQCASKLLYLRYLVFPICYTAVSHCIIGSIFSSFICLSNAVLDYEPLKQLAAIIGSTGITFTIVLISSTFAHYFVILTFENMNFPSSNYNSNAFRDELLAKKTQFKMFLTIIIGLFIFFMTVTGFIVQTDVFYQRPVQTQINPQWQVSCIFPQNAKISTTLRDSVWNITKDRAEKGDKIILWSEEGFLVESAHDEDSVLAQASYIAISYSVYIGVTYMKDLPDEAKATNQFALITPKGEVAWNYHKAYPVPFIEDNIKAGPPVLPTYYDPDSDLKFGGAICFDFDFSQYIRQAGSKKVDILLQPSWTWNAISSRHMNGDSVRAVENGVNIFRCSSMGESGTVGPRGQVNNRQYTGSATADSATIADVPVTVFYLPLARRVSTMYAAIGFIFEYIIMSLAIVFYLLVSFPGKYFFPFINSYLADNNKK